MALAEPETPPPTDLSYVDEMEQIVDERRRSQLDPELFGELAEGSTEQASGSSAEPRERGRTSPLTAEITVGGINRGLGYSGYDRGPLTAYSLPFGATLGFGAEWYPAAHFGNDAVANGFGVAWRFQSSLGLQSAAADGSAYPTDMYAWEVGARYRGVLPEIGVELIGIADIGRRGFHVRRGDLQSPTPAGVYGVDYLHLRLGAQARYSVEDLGFALRAAYLPVLESGAFGEVLHTAGAHGLEAALRFSYRLPLGFSIFAELDSQVFWSSFSPPEGAEVVAGGATDHYLGVNVGAEWRMPAEAEL